MNRLLWLLVGLLVAAVIPLLLGGRAVIGKLAQFPPDLLTVMLGMIVLCWCLNAQRLRLLLGPRLGDMNRRQSLGVIMATECAICATPGGSGGPLALIALLKRYGVRPAQSSAVFAMDQFNDLLFFLLAVAGILIYALFHSLSAHLEWMLGSSALLISLALGVGLGGARYHRQLLRLNGRLLARLQVASRTRWRLARKCLHFRDAFVEATRLPRRQWLLVFSLTCLHWGLRYSVLYLALRGFGVDIQWAWSFLIQMLSLSAGQLSLLPGGTGTAELTSAALLAPLVGKATAGAAILVWRAVSYYFYLLAGGPVLLLMLGRPLLRRLLHADQA